MPIAHVMFDADGVLQDLPGGWHAAIEPYLGALKPEEAFFAEAVRRIGDDPGHVLFIDDTEENVEGARGAGLAAEHWHFSEGHDVLLGHLRRHGVTVIGDG